MNKKFLISWVLVFVVWMAGSFLVHGVLLGGGYADMPNLGRPEAEMNSVFHFMLIAHIIMAGAFVWIYARGTEDKPWHIQGLRFGIAIALLAVVPTYMIYYVVQPWPGMFVIKQIVFDGTLVLLLGLLVGFLYRQDTGQ